MRLSPSCLLTNLAVITTVVAAGDPITIKLEGRRGKTSSKTTKRSSAVNVELTSWHRSTDLQWYGKISVGTPAQEFNVLFDTGSMDLILPRIGCTTCANYTLFDPAKSSTFANEPGLNFSATFSTGSDGRPLTTPAALDGHIVSDVVSFGIASVENQTFLLCESYPDALGEYPLGPNIDGIFGIGPPNSSDFSGLNVTFSTPFWNLVADGSLPEPIFSMYLNSEPEAPHGELTLGGVNPSMYDGELQTVDFNKTITDLAGQWYIDNPNFYVNGEAVENSETGERFPAAVSLLDTGTAFILTPDFQTAKDMYAKISPEIEQLDKAGTWGADCDVMEKLDPELTFTIGSGDKMVNLTIAKNSFNLGEYEAFPGKCQGIILNSPEPVTDVASVWIIGGPVLKNYYTVWDGVKLTLGVGNLKGSGTGGGDNPSPTAPPTAVPTSGGIDLKSPVWAIGAVAVSLLFFV